jgi:hypothetical protein
LKQGSHGTTSQKTAVIIVAAVEIANLIKAITDWALWRRSNVFPVTYGLGIYIPEYGNSRSHHSENLKSYTELTGWAL